MIRQEIVTVSFFPHSQNIVRMMEIVIETNWWWEYFACQDLFINLCIDDNRRNHGKWSTFKHREREILPYFGQFWLFCREFTNCLTYFLWAAEYQNWQIKGMNLWWVWSWEYDEPFSSGLGRINGRSGKTTSVGVCLTCDSWRYLMRGGEWVKKEMGFEYLVPLNDSFDTAAKYHGEGAK